MIVLWIIGGIVLLLVLILSLSATLYVHFDSQLYMKIGIAGLRVWLVNPNKMESSEQTEKDEEKSKDKELSSQKAEASSETEQAQKKTGFKSTLKPQKPSAEERGSSDRSSSTASLRGLKQTFSDFFGDKQEGSRSFVEIIQLILEILSIILNPSLDLLRKTRITALDVRMNIGSEEASDTALSYTGICSGIYYALAVLQSNIVVRVKHIVLNANFVSGEITQDVSFKVKIRLSDILWAILRMIGRYLRNTIKEKNRQVNLNVDHEKGKC